VYFGQNLVCKESLSGKGEGKIIKVGDPVYVMEVFASSNEAPACILLASISHKFITIEYKKKVSLCTLPTASYSLFKVKCQ
jgi:hypothetical protein